MRILCVGGGPGGLYFALLMKKSDPRHEITVVERSSPDATFGFGVVFSDATMAEIAAADTDAYREIAAHLVRWDDIEVHPPGADYPVRSTGHGFSGISRRMLLGVLGQLVGAAGVDLRIGTGIRTWHDVQALGDYDLVVASDGANSTMRALLADCVRTETDVRPNRFVWLGTSRPFPAFSFFFRENEHGLWRAHAYGYAPGRSTFIAECREETWRHAGMERASEADTVSYLERLFARELDGHPLVSNHSVWRQFTTIRTEPWSSGNVVLLGDAAHTAHFSVGSGTRMAMEDAIALRDALLTETSGSSRTPHEAAAGVASAFSPSNVAPAIPPSNVASAFRRKLEAASPSDVASAFRRKLEAYEQARRPRVESLQRAAQASLDWLEHTERYRSLDPVRFSFSLITRSLRITHDDLKQRDPAFLARVNETVASNPATPPMFTPFRLRDLVLANRVVVSPMCQYMADDGTVGDWHLVHLGSRAMGGAGLVMAEMTDVARDARISPACAGLYKDEHADAWKRIVDFVHTETPAKIGVQLGHAGRKGATKRLWEGDSEPLTEGSWPIVSASPRPYFADRSVVPREMTRADMDAVVDDYVSAAVLADAAGFDLLEIHMAHGYLLASFISPLTNKRTDAYGGVLGDRLRFPLEVFSECRAAWPQHKPMSVRISAVDWAPGGLEPTDAVEVARALKAQGCDIVDVSAGQTVPDQQPVYGRLFQTPFADRIRYEAGIHTMAVGNISSYADVNTIIAAGRADLCLLARAHLFDPYWTRHAATMQGYALPWPDPYKSVERYTSKFGFRL